MKSKKIILSLAFGCLLLSSCDLFATNSASSNVNSINSSSSFEESSDSSSSQDNSSSDSSSSSSTSSSSSSTTSNSTSSTTSNSTSSSSSTSTSTSTSTSSQNINTTCESPLKPTDGSLLGKCNAPKGVPTTQTFKGVEYTYAWSDEFNGNSLDTNFWSHDTGTGSGGWGNNEKQYYRAENTSVSDGLLQITAKNETYGGKYYTSSRIKSQNKMYFTYGFIEARISMPSFKGAWPAFWMLGQNFSSVGWPTSGEIDIMEAINDEHNKTYSAFHWSANGSTADHPYPNLGFTLSTPRTEMHLYQLVWNSNSMVTYIDGQQNEAFTITNNTPAFRLDQFFLFNLAVGGNWPEITQKTIDATAMPATMKVDYVRVYQK